MAETGTEFQHFEHLADYSIAVYKECRHGVLPSHIQSHLQHAHKIEQKQAEEIAERVRSWPGLIEYASEFQEPSQVVLPISQLPVYSDGLSCQLDNTRCDKQELNVGESKCSAEWEYKQRLLLIVTVWAFPRSSSYSSTSEG
jgi:hypothetical protein